MNIIIIGAPGSGKGTHSKIILEKYNNINYISISDILRKENNIEYNSKISKGNLLDDKIVFNLLKEYIKKNNIKDNILLDGFPRTYNQSKLIDNLININIIIELYLDDKIILERILGRRIHKKSGRIYHIIYNPPFIEGTDNLTGELLEIRDDDKKELVLKRISEYNKNILEIKKFFKDKIDNKKIHFIKIDTNDTIENINSIILNKLSESSSIGRA